MAESTMPPGCHTYTFLWPAREGNELGLWLQKFTAVAESIEQAWDRLVTDTAGHDWAPHAGISVLLLVGEHHVGKYYRVVYREVPLGLTGVHVPEGTRFAAAMEHASAKASKYIQASDGVTYGPFGGRKSEPYNGPEMPT